TTMMLLSILLLIGSVTNAEEQQPKAASNATIVKADYLITGLHCPPCTKTVESSLQHVKGIHSIKVDWKTKNARIEFDESVLSAQKVARLIADTPHMMGKNMHYDGWLALKVSEIENEESAKPVADALQKI